MNMKSHKTMLKAMMSEKPQWIPYIKKEPNSKMKPRSKGTRERQTVETQK